MRKPMVKMSLEMSPKLDIELERMSEEAHISKSALLRKALALLKVALDSKREGRKLAVVNDKKEFVGEIVGL